jgi:predicted dehydrogenase
VSDLRGAVIGCGFFARNHLHAWRDVQGANIVAVCDADLGRAEAYAADFGIPMVYQDPEAMLRSGGLDFVDVVTQAATHRPLVELAARHRTDVICQKPLAPDLEDARTMVAACRAAGVRLMVHENFRWQTPIRALKEAAGELGPLFFGRLYWRTAFDVYRDQPYLAEDARFILADLGVHLLDLARFVLGEADTVYCRTQRINPRIQGEDVATVLLGMESGATCLAEMSYASRVPNDPFPQTLIDLEGPLGTASLGRDFRLTVVTAAGTREITAEPGPLPWANPSMRHIQESVVRIQQHWVNCLREGREPETSGDDNLRTLELVEASYASAAAGEVVQVNR